MQATARALPAESTHGRLTLKNILFPTDFSDASRIALPWAQALAQRFGARLHLAHITRPMVYPVGPAEALAGPFDTSLYAEELMAQLREDCPGCDTSTWIVHGLIEDVVPELIHEHDIDWIILGTHGRTGIRKLLMGSVAEEILKATTVPALTLGPHVLDRPESNASQLPLKRILCVADFSSLGERAMDLAFSMAQEERSQLTLLHVVRGYTHVPPAEQTFLKKKFERLLRELSPPPPSRRSSPLDSAAGDLWCQPEFLVEVGEHAEKVLDSAVYKNMDLIVQSVIPGLSRHAAVEVIRQAQCPVLTVRA